MPTRFGDDALPIDSRPAGPELSKTPPIGTVLLGKYRVDRVLGEGGMGVVLAAHHLGLETPVAIKMMLAKYQENAEAQQRFEREARAAAQLRSRHVVRVMDTARTSDGVAFMVMELLHGHSLFELQAERGAFPVWQAVEYVLHACEGLAAAHALGIIHRDIKPANLFIAELPDGLSCLKLLDFGISKFGLDDKLNAPPGLTKPQVAMGTANYMAPEQFDAALADARSDIWALGLVLRELLTGESRQKPYWFPPPPLFNVRPDAPLALQQLIDDCLQLDPSRRPASVLSVARTLAAHGPASAEESVKRIAYLLRHVVSGPEVAADAVDLAQQPTMPHANAASGQVTQESEDSAVQGVSNPAQVDDTTESTEAEDTRQPQVKSDVRARERPARASARPERMRPSQEESQYDEALLIFDELTPESPAWPAKHDDESALIEALVQKTKIFVDDSFLLRPAAQTFLIQRVLPALERHESAKLILPKRVFESLRQQARSKDAQGTLAARALSTLNELMARERLDLRGEQDEVAGSTAGLRDLLARIVFQYQIKYELTFLTSEEDTARLLTAANSSKAISYRKSVRVLSVDDQGRVLPWIRGLEEPHFDDDGQPARLDLARVARGTRIFIDTCTWMLPVGVQLVRRHVIPILGIQDRRLMVPERVLFELKKGTQNVDSREARECAAQSLAILDELVERGVADVRREEHEVMGAQNFADPLFIRLFVQHQKSVPLVLITQDRGLATQVLLNARLLDAGAMTPIVGFASEGHMIARGELANWLARLATQDRSVRKVPAAAGPTRERAQPFVLATEVYRQSKAALPVDKLPRVGDFIEAPRAGRVQLLKELAEGGEGTIYETSLPDIVCKVYFEERLTEDRKSKLMRMVTRPPPAPTVCWPLELAYNDKRQFVGCLMPRAYGEVMNDVVFMPKVLQKDFPTWGRFELVQLAISTLAMIKRLHELNIVIGDINQNNWMVTEQGDVYLVDTDSFQIEEFPCPVGTLLFTPPELIGCTYADLLRTKEQEQFAVATLVFMILMLGKAPYSMQDGGEMAECIKQQRFPYKKTEGERSRKPLGVYKFIWSHLPKSLKDDFIEIFADGRRVPEPDQDQRRFARPHTSYVDRLLHDLRGYADNIKKGRSNNELMPTELWLRSDQETIDAPCETVGCTRTNKMLRAWYDEMLSKNQRILCPIHDEVRRLRKADPRPERAPARSSSRPVVTSAVHPRASSGFPPARHASARPAAGWRPPAIRAQPPVRARLPAWVVPLAVFLSVFLWLLGALR